jgi:hypothetical protein
MEIAKVKPWTTPAPFKIDGSVFSLDVQETLVNYCLEVENMYEYCDGDFTAVFDLTEPLYMEDPTEGDPDEEIIDYTAVIKQHLPADYKESSIGVFFCNG